LDAIADPTEKLNRLVELNVEEQVYNLCRTTVVQNAWKERPDLEVHGWVIDLKTGLVKDLNVSHNDAHGLGYVYELDEESVNSH
jgi:carbonic anhydrase